MSELRMRVGDERRVLYLQRGVEPSALDTPVAMADTAELAMKLVEAWNAYYPEPDPDAGPSLAEQVKERAAERARHEERER